MSGAGVSGAKRRAGVQPSVSDTRPWSGLVYLPDHSRRFQWRFATIDDFCAACGQPIVHYPDGWHHKDRKVDKRHQAMPKEPA